MDKTFCTEAVQGGIRWTRGDVGCGQKRIEIDFDFIFIKIYSSSILDSHTHIDTAFGTRMLQNKGFYC